MTVLIGQFERVITFARREFIFDILNREYAGTFFIPFSQFYQVKNNMDLTNET